MKLLKYLLFRVKILLNISEIKESCVPSDTPYCYHIDTERVLGDTGLDYRGFLPTITCPYFLSSKYIGDEICKAMSLKETFKKNYRPEDQVKCCCINIDRDYYEESQ